VHLVASGREGATQATGLASTQEASTAIIEHQASGTSKPIGPLMALVSLSQDSCQFRGPRSLWSRADFVAKRFLGICQSRCSGGAPKLIPISFVEKIAIRRKGRREPRIRERHIS
jgi:hypothetical protein